MPWEPVTEAEILSAIPDMRESETFDAKRQPGPIHKAVDYAVDVAAMANHGGSIVYGIAEPEPGIFKATPFDISNQAERVSQGVVSNTADPPPRFRVWPVRSEREDGKGYLVVTVEASPMAPHMVAGRFHGRKGPTNYELGQGDVDSLYARRRLWEEEAGQTLEQAMSRHILSDGALIYLYVVVRPLFGDRDLVHRAWPDWRDLPAAVGAASESLPFVQLWDPSLSRYASFQHRRLTGGTALVGFDQQEPQQLAVFRDGTIQLFESKLASEAKVRDDNGSEQTIKLIREGCVAQLTAHTLALARDLLAAADYQGPVVVGAALRGIRGTQSASTSQIGFSPIPLGVMDIGVYRQVERTSTADLRDPIGMARRLVGEVLAVVLPAGVPDPFNIRT